MNEYDKQWCTKILTELNKMPITIPFRMPVDTTHDAPNYLKIIAHPMDFGTMKKKLTNEEYKSVQSFIDDIKLISHNAKLFNGEQSIFSLMCDDILTEVQKKFCEKADNSHQEWLNSLNKAVSEMKNHMKFVPAASVTFKEIPIPDISSLSQDQIEKIETEIGDSIDTLEKRWKFLNEITQKSIAQIVH